MGQVSSLFKRYLLLNRINYRTKQRAPLKAREKKRFFPDVLLPYIRLEQSAVRLEHVAFSLRSFVRSKSPMLNLKRRVPLRSALKAIDQKKSQRKSKAKPKKLAISKRTTMIDDMIEIFGVKENSRGIKNKTMENLSIFEILELEPKPNSREWRQEALRLKILYREYRANVLNVSLHYLAILKKLKTRLYTTIHKKLYNNIKSSYSIKKRTFKPLAVARWKRSLRVVRGKEIYRAKKQRLDPELIKHKTRNVETISPVRSKTMVFIKQKPSLLFNKDNKEKLKLKKQDNASNRRFSRELFNNRVMLTKSYKLGQRKKRKNIYFKSQSKHNELKQWVPHQPKTAQRRTFMLLQKEKGKKLKAAIK